MASPASRLSAPNSRIDTGVMVDIATRCAGCANDCATQRSLASKKAHEKSARVLMLVENAARRTVTAISSVKLTTALRITSKVTGSIPELRGEVLSVLLVMDNGLGWCYIASQLGSRRIMRLPVSSTSTRVLGGTTTVVSICSMMAGPEKVSPERSWSRS